jgi:hypothetical protein
MTLSVNLRVSVGLSYPQIVQCLSYFQVLGWLESGPLPCANTIQNWVSKMGLYTLLHPDVSVYATQEVCVMIDQSIQIGQEKMLMVLYAPVSKQEARALCYADVQVAYLEGRTSWTSAAISEVVSKQLAKDGLTAVYALSDEESTLRRGILNLNMAHVPDIGHAIATCLRHVFEKEAAYQAYLKLMGQYQAKGVNQALSYSIPRKQRTKARFMNQHIHVDWATSILSKYDTLDHKAKLFYQELLAHRPIIEALAQCLAWAETLAVDIKTAGISQNYLIKKREEIQHLIRGNTHQKTDIDIDIRTTPEIPLTSGDAPKDTSQNSSYFHDFLKEIDEYLSKYQLVLANEPDAKYHASSDVIESLFGKYKSLRNDNKWVGMTDTVLEIPLMKYDAQDIHNKLKQALENTCVSDIKQWKESHTIENQNVKRIKLFKTQTRKKTD